MGEVRVSQAGVDDALVVAGLTLQCALHRGGHGEPGFLDRFAGAWVPQAGSRPVWIAEAGGEHAGLLLAAALPALPWPSRPAGGGVLLVETFFVRPAHRGVGVGEQLLRAAVAWSRGHGFSQIRMVVGPHTRPMVERVGFSADAAAYRMELS